LSSYDRLDWHLDSAIEAGQPPENAFTHIGLYLAWLIRHDLHNPEVFPSSHVAAVKSGEMSGSDVADDVDTKLVSGVMNDEGRSFSDAFYSRYLDEFGSVFADEPDYGVADTEANYARIALVLDRMYAEWVAASRPMPVGGSVDEAIDATALPVGELTMSIDDIHRINEEIAAGLGGAVMIPGEDVPHAAPRLEALIPTDLTAPPMDVWSLPVNEWGSSLVSRAVKRLGARPEDAAVVTGMGGFGPGTLAVTIYRVPGADPERLLAQFETAIAHPMVDGDWSSREIHGRQVRWATGPEFTAAFWARDDMVVHVAGEVGPVEAAIARLP
jgi:hypothetical protein